MRAASVALSLAAAASCGPCSRPAVPILTWHAVSQGPSGDAFTVSELNFTQQLDALSGYQTVSFHELLEGNLPARALILTFDDGTEDAFTRVLPELKKRKLRATFFLVSGFLGPDPAHRHVEPNGARYLIWSEVQALREAGMEIGSHSVDHARLPDLPEARVREELVRSKAELEAGLGAPVEVFAYPFNSVRRSTRAQVVAAGYRAAAAGTVHGSGDRFELYRIGVYRDTSAANLLALLPQ